MAPQPPTILLVEDDPDDARVVFLAFEGLGAKIIHVRNGSDALEALQGQEVAACLVDQRLPDMTGVELIRQLRHHTDASIIMVSGVREDQTVAAAFEAGADDFLIKNLDYGVELSSRVDLPLAA